MSSLLRVLFVVYCIEAGLFLVIAPWREFWNLLVSRSALSQAHLGAFLLLPWIRGAVTGFGLIHLIWGIHDLERILLGRRGNRSKAPTRKFRAARPPRGWSPRGGNRGKAPIPESDRAG